MLHSATNILRYATSHALNTPACAEGLGYFVKDDGVTPQQPGPLLARRYDGIDAAEFGYFAS